jgi:hypothetical protein
MIHQYARSAGDLTLCQALAKRYSRVLSRTIQPLTEVVTTNGASKNAAPEERELGAECITCVVFACQQLRPFSFRLWRF